MEILDETSVKISDLIHDKKCYIAELCIPEKVFCVGWTGYKIIFVSYPIAVRSVRDAFQKKNYVDRETVPISSDPPTIETVSEHLDRECW